MAIKLDGSGVNTTGIINSMTAQNSTSGTNIDFTGIPVGVKRITVIFNEVSVASTATFLIQIGSGSFTTTGYVSSSGAVNFGAGTGGQSSTSGFCINVGNAGFVTSGHMIITLLSSNVWISSHSVKNSTSQSAWGGGSVTLSGTLDRLRITTVEGATFDNGSVNVLYE